MTASACGHIDFITVPPTLEFFIEHVADVSPDLSIDRTIPRCKLCDLIRTAEKADEVDYDFMKSTRNHLTMTGQRNADEEYDPEMKATLVECPPTMISHHEKVRKTQEDAQLAIWKKYWGIWGHVDGPDREDEIVGDEEVLWDFGEVEQVEGTAGKQEELEIDWDAANDTTLTQDLFEPTQPTEELKPAILQNEEAEKAQCLVTKKAKGDLSIKSAANVNRHIESKGKK